MGVKKYKYYFKKPKSAVVKDIFNLLLVSGVICVAATSPHFIQNVIKSRRRWEKYPKKKIQSAFSRLKRQGFLEIKNNGKQIYVSLTKKGKEKAGYFQINDLEIKKPAAWDKKWRLVMFDIVQIKRIHRESFRGKLKELGFRPLQKSVWIHPYECHAEIDLLKGFFGLSDDELRLITASKIGHEEDLRKSFDLKYKSGKS